MRKRKLTAARKARHARLGIGPAPMISMGMAQELEHKPLVVAYGASFEGDTTRTRAGFSSVGGTRGLYRRRIRGAE